MRHALHFLSIAILTTNAAEVFRSLSGHAKPPWAEDVATFRSLPGLECGPPICLTSREYAWR